jgi:hypothetical protein
MSAVKDEADNIVNYVGVQCIINEQMAAAYFSKVSVKNAREQASSLYPELTAE